MFECASCNRTARRCHTCSNLTTLYLVLYDVTTFSFQYLTVVVGEIQILRKMQIVHLFAFSLVLILPCVSTQISFPNEIAHRAVIQNAKEEALLPPHLLNNFYKDPRISAALARSSWFGPGEKLVREREADLVPKKDIFILLNHAGLLPQQRS